MPAKKKKLHVPVKATISKEAHNYLLVSLALKRSEALRCENAANMSALARDNKRAAELRKTGDKFTQSANLLDEILAVLESE